MKKLSKATIKKLLPEIDDRKVSIVARGKRKSRATKTGYLQEFFFGNTKKLATKNQTYEERRLDFISRHLSGPGPMWMKNGRPTRKHLALISWAYSPDPKRLAQYISDMGYKNKNISPYVKQPK